MKRIEAIIRPEKVQAVKEALIDMGQGGITVYDVVGHGTQKLFGWFGGGAGSRTRTHLPSFVT